MNPATFLAHKVQEGQEVHDCTIHPPDESARAEEDPIPNSKIMFVDGSSVIDQETGVRHTGAAVVTGDNQTSSDSLKIMAQLTLLLRLSAQAAELIALIEALT